MAIGRRRSGSRGYTLIELMTTVAMVGIMAMTATVYVRQYALHAKTAEATNTLGAIGRSATMAFYRERMSSAVLATGQSATTTTSGWVTGGGSKGKGAIVTHHPGLCGDTTAVPESLTQIQGSKYQPRNTADEDYETGDDANGWICLRFANDMPQYFQFMYLGGLSSHGVSVQLPHGGEPPGLADRTIQWAAQARGDLDGDGVTSWYLLYGQIDGDRLITAPNISTVDEDD